MLILAVGIRDKDKIRVITELCSSHDDAADGAFGSIDICLTCRTLLMTKDIKWREVLDKAEKI